MTTHRPTAESRWVLVTGATGLVGREVVAMLELDPRMKVVGVSRRGDSVTRSVAWDLSIDPPPQTLKRRWDVVINAAANTRWTMSEDEAKQANVASVLGLKPLISENTRFVHVSTAYALGLRGTVDSLDPADYRNTYEWSKAQAERVVRETYPQATIVRPSLIVGRRSDGQAARFSGMYTLVRGIVLGTVPAIVAGQGARFDAIPVDDLAQLILDQVSGDCCAGSKVRTVAAGTNAPTVEQAVQAILRTLNEWRRKQKLDPVKSPPLIDPDSWDRFFRPFVLEHLSPRQKRILDLLQSFEPYLAISTPLRPDHAVKDILPCVEASTNYWAEANPRVARLTPTMWQGKDGQAPTPDEVTRA